MLKLNSVLLLLGVALLAFAEGFFLFGGQLPHKLPSPGASNFDPVMAVMAALLVLFAHRMVSSPRP